MGVCFRLVLAAWPRGGKIPKEHLRRLSGVFDDALWTMLWPAIADLWPETEDGKCVYWPGMPEAVARAQAARSAAQARGRRRWEARDQQGDGQGDQQGDGQETPDSGLRTLGNEHRTPNTEPSRSPGGDRAAGGYSDSFVRFWNAWPKKAKKADAWRVWRSKHCDQHLDAILSALAWQTKSGKWTAGYVPNPDAYLRGECWEDEPSSYDRKGNGTPARDIRVGRFGAEECKHGPQTGVVTT